MTVERISWLITTDVTCNAEESNPGRSIHSPTLYRSSYHAAEWQVVFIHRIIFYILPGVFLKYPGNTNNVFMFYRDSLKYWIMDFVVAIGKWSSYLTVFECILEDCYKITLLFFL